MPSITTHHFFSKEILNHLTKKELSKIDKELIIYHTFAQSHDYLFYYTFDFKNAKKIQNLGHIAHHKNTQEYIINIIKKIKKHHLENNQQAVAYLYGVITHYVLDTTCHPFIFYKTGVYRKNDKMTHKYHGEHNHIEKDIDAIIYQKYTNQKYNKCNLNKDIIKKPLFNQTLINLINQVYQETYNIKNIGNYYIKSIKHTKIINSLIINDYFGIKRAIYTLIDTITNHKTGYIEAYSTHILNPNLGFLNNEHKTWNHPSNPSLTYTYSFEDLYNISIKKTLTIIKEINKVLYENKPIKDIIEYIPNIDYSTGMLIEESRKMNYFEY